MADPIIKVHDVRKHFILPHTKATTVKQLFLNLRKKKNTEKFEALKGVSFEVARGDFYGIVGKNGSGKSTLLKMLAGVYTPNSGDIMVNGSITPFIELGVGFNPELSGRENVFLNGALLGFTRKQMTKMYQDIVDFAELEQFMDQKLKNYSSGMQVRLAFSIAIRAESDILIIDEVLAVGDAAFQRKCFNYFMSLKKNKRTVVLVTHDMGAVRQYCNKAIMINDGDIIARGSPEKVAQAYQQFFTESIDGDAKKMAQNTQAKRWGNGNLRAEKPKIDVTKDHILISCNYRARINLPPPIYGFTIYGPAGNNIVEGNTEREKFETSAVKSGDKVNLTWKIPNMFVDGLYNVTIACCDESKTDFYDWFNEAGSFNVNRQDPTGGLINPIIEIPNYKVTGGHHG